MTLPGGIRELRRRMRAIEGTRQLTQAMKMIATARLAPARKRVAAASAYAAAVRTMLADLAAAGEAPPALADLLAPREVRRDLYVVFASDRGLCGGFNHNLVHLTLAAMDDHPGASHRVLPVGRRTLKYFRRLGSELSGGYTSVGDDIPYSLARAIASEVYRLYVSGEVDAISVVYGELVNPLVQRPRLLRLLPLPPEEWQVHSDSRRDAPAAIPRRLYTYEPDPAAFFARLVPRYIAAQIYLAAVQSKASEHAARITAMETATENAADMLHRLTLSLHRARQTRITAELAELVSGAVD